MKSRSVSPISGHLADGEYINLLKGGIRQWRNCGITLQIKTNLRRSIHELTF